MKSQMEISELYAAVEPLLATSNETGKMSRVVATLANIQHLLHLLNSR
jgi:hypothetical protein